MATRLLFVLFCLFAARATAQTFAPVEGQILRQEVHFGLANECFIHFKNNSGDSLRLKWRRLEVSKPDGWKIDLCDYGTCYVGIPTSGLMNTLHDTAEAYLKLIVLPGQTSGAAWLWFRVFENGHDDNFQDVFFDLHTPGTTSADNPVQTDGLQAFPNPVGEVLHLKNNLPESQFVRLFDSLGRLVFEKNIPSGSLETVPTGELPAGNYWLQTAGRARQIIIEK